MVYAQKEILLDQQLPTNPPTGWAAMQDEILSFSHDTDTNWNAAGHGKTGLFIVVSDERPYFPLSFLQQNTELFIFDYPLHLLAARDLLTCHFL